MSLPGGCQTAGLPRSPARVALGRMGEGGFPWLLPALNLFSTVPCVPQCFVQPLREASGSKEQKCFLTSGKGLYKYPQECFHSGPASESSAREAMGFKNKRSCLVS